MNKTFVLLVAASAVSVSGCSSFLSSKNVAGDFQCGVAEGEGCRSIADIRSMINTGGPTAVHYNAGSTSVSALAGSQVSVSGVPKWNSDVVLKVHVGTYVDNQGDYHEDGVMYLVARRGGWETE